MELKPEIKQSTKTDLRVDLLSQTLTNLYASLGPKSTSILALFTSFFVS